MHERLTRRALPVPYCTSGSLTIEAASFAIYLCPPALALAVAVATGALGSTGVAYCLVWLGAECAVALAAACSEEDASARSLVGQVGTMTVCLFIHFRGQIDPAVIDGAANLEIVASAVGGAVAGGMLAAWQCSLARVVLQATTSLSHDAVDRLLVSAAARLAVQSWAMGALLAWLGAPLAGGVLPAIATPLCAVVWSATRRRRLALHGWLSRVDAGGIVGWRIVECRPAWVSIELQPLTGRGPAAQYCRVLATAMPGRHPFREPEAVVPVALVA